MSAQKSASNPPIGFIPYFSGGGIGTLIGILIGLSVSPIVGTILGALAALLAAFLGLTEQESSKKIEEPFEIHENKRRVREARAGSFGLACTIGVLLDLFLRVQNVFGIPLEEQFKEWVQLGYSPAEARNIILFKELGISSLNSSEGVTTNVNDPKSRSDITVLYKSSPEVCKDLHPNMFSNVQEVLNQWNMQGGHWQKVAKEIETNVPIAYQDSTVNLIWRILCSLE